MRLVSFGAWGRFFYAMAASDVCAFIDKGDTKVVKYIRYMHSKHIRHEKFFPII